MSVVAAAPAPAATATASAFAGYVAEGLLAPWPGGTLLAGPVKSALSAAVSRVHAQATGLAGRPVPFDRWLGAMAGAPDGSLAGDALARQAADLFLGIVNRVTRPPAQLAATSLPPPAGTFPSPMPTPAPPIPAGFTPPTNWNGETVRRALLRLGKIGALELATLPPRLAVATAMAQTAIALPGIRSTRDVGNVVHPLLQGRYRGSYVPQDLVVTDRRVFGSSGPLRLPVTGTRLSDAAKASAHPQLVTLYLSSLDQELRRSIKRTDVTDFTRLANWEIKPVLSAPIGVMQEAWYRCAYNWMAGEFANQVPELAAELAPLRPGPTWDPGMMGVIYVPPVGGQPAAAVPFTTMTLPGMVLYIVVSGPTMIDLALLAALMLQLIEREVQRRLAQATAAVRVILALVAAQLELILNQLLEALILFVVLIAIAGLAVALIFKAPIVAGATVVILIVSGVAYLIEKVREGQGAEAGEGTLITLDFPGVSVRLPAADSALFCGAAELVIAGAFRALHDDVRAQLPGDVA